MATSPRLHQLLAQARFFIDDHRGIPTHEYEYIMI